MTPRVFVAPGLLAHLRRSVIDGVRAEELRLTDPVLREEIRREYSGHPLKLWAVKDTVKHAWTEAKPGDWLLFYHHGSFRYAGQVASLYPREETTAQLTEANSLAEQVWQRDPRDGKTWPYLFFLTEVRELDLPLTRFNELTGYRFVALPGFLHVAEQRRAALLEVLGESAQRAQPPRAELSPHEAAAQKIYELGEIIGYRPEVKWRREGFEYDVVWHRPPREGPKCVFEVHVKGDLGEALLRLKHAWDRWESQLFLVSTEAQIEQAKSKYLVGALHELAETGALTLVPTTEVEAFYQFKGRFEWLERRFGLRPR